MSLFGALPITQSGMEVSQTWLDALSGNIANSNDTVAANQPVYQEVYVNVAPLAPTQTPGELPAGQGATVSSLTFGSSAGTLAYEPTNPLANGQGLVKVANVNLSDQLVGSVMAQTDYAANVAMNQRAEAAYKSALTIA